MSKRNVLVPLVLLIALSATPALAEAKSGFYLGGSVGQSFYDINNINGSGTNLDDSDFAWKGFAGYRFGWIAVEADYRDFGEVQDASGGQPVTYSSNAFDLSAALMFPIGPFDIIGRAGASAWESDVSGVGSVTEPDGTDLMYGVGAAFRLGSVSIRLEIERFDFDPDPVDMVSVGASYTF